MARITVRHLQTFLCRYEMQEELELYADVSGNVLYVRLPEAKLLNIPDLVEEDQKFLKGMGIQA